MREFLYKYGLIMFLIVAISVLAIQKESNEVIPKEAVVITINTPVGFLPVLLRKGLLSKNNEGKTWITAEEYKNKVMKRKPQLRVDNRHTFEVNKGKK